MGVGTGILAPSAVDARAKRERTAGVGSDLSGRRRLCFAPEFVDTIGGPGTHSGTSPTPPGRRKTGNRRHGLPKSWSDADQMAPDGHSSALSRPPTTADQRGAAWCRQARHMGLAITGLFWAADGGGGFAFSPDAKPRAAWNSLARLFQAAE